jgi:hypothetical protein
MLNGPCWQVREVRDSVHSVPLFRQIAVLMKRRLMLTARDRNFLRVRIGMSLLQAGPLTLRLLLDTASFYSLYGHFDPTEMDSGFGWIR